MDRIRLRSSDFRKEREKQWVQLQGLVDRIEKKGIKSLSSEELYRLPSLYRLGVSSLSVARSITLSQNMLDYLESLVTRAYFCVWGVKPRPKHTIRRFFLQQFPKSVQHIWISVLLAILLVFAGTLVGYHIHDSETYHLIMPEAMAQGRSPTSSTQDLKQVLYSGKEDTGSELGLFATFLATHNARIGLLSFALGFALGLPSIILLFYNGLVLGTMAGLYASRGLGLEFWAWVLPHGVTEILAICLCGGAGLAVGMAIIVPGRYGRLEHLVRNGRQGALIVLGAVFMFFLAGIIEGFFRQIVHDLPTRYAMAGATAFFWLVYLVLRKDPTGDP